MIDLNMCGQEKADGTRCYKQCQHGDTMCKLHRTVATRREQRRREEAVWNEVLDLLWLERGNVTLTDLNNIVADAEDRGWIAHEVADQLRFDVREQLRMYRILHPEQPNATTELQRLALDAQNVHTKAVTQQTTEAQEFLLKTSIPKGQKTMEEITVAWEAKDSKKVLKDMASFYKMDDNDYLYKRMLDGLWARIQSHPEKAELVQRLWEETSEAVTKCYQGHICRLGNVMVGFTEEVKAEVPLGEILQQKMAAIAAKDVDVLHKVCEAWFVCEDLHVPQEERGAWIEAF